MKHEKLATALMGALLGFLTALGAVGCFVTAFDLSLEHTAGPALVGGGFALLAAAAFSFRYGKTALLCLTALLLGYIYHDGRAAAQLQQLLHDLSVIYDKAYGWGVLQFPDTTGQTGYMDWPMGIFAAAAAVAVCRCICCRKSTWLPVLTVLIPLSACIVVTDTVPKEIWLLVVMACLTLLVLTASVRRENNLQGLRLTAAASLPLVIALTILFLLVPQKSYVNQSQALQDNLMITARNFPQLVETGLQDLAENFQTHPQKRVNLANLGPRVTLTYPVMKVKAENGGILYLRGQDYDTYTGKTWTASEQREEFFFQTGAPCESILIQTHGWKDLRYLSYYPGEETLLTGGSLANAEGIKEYTLLHSPLPDNWRQIAYRNQATAGRELDSYLTLPDATRQSARQMLLGLLPTGASNTEKADIIASMVTGSARYDLDTRKMPDSEPDFALWFLQKSETGYCIHFATAATVLLRAADIPARYVTGYLLTAKAGETVTVTEEDAHAWAEYFEPGLNAWIPLEATPAEEAPTVTLEFLPVSTETESTEPSEEPEPTTAETTEQTIPQPTQTPEESSAATSPTEPSREPEPARKGNVLPFLLLAIAVLVLLPVQRSLRLTLRRRQQHRGDTNRQALLRWRETVRLSRLLKEPPAEQLLHLAQKAKFSQHRITQEELALFDGYRRAYLQKLREKPWYLQLIYRYIFAVC